MMADNYYTARTQDTNLAQVKLPVESSRLESKW